MQTISLYRYTRADGGMTVSTVKPDTEYTELFRLVADEGHVLTDGSTTAPCVDTDNPDVWIEIVDSENEDTESGELSETEQKALAYDILTGVSE